MPLEQHITAADREVGLAVINRILPTYAKGIHAANACYLTHEAERLETLPKSPVISSMRAIVDNERALRQPKAEA